MKILISCEESQEVCKAFRTLGHETYSCDILPCSGGHPEWHIQADVLPLLNGRCQFNTMDGKEHIIQRIKDRQAATEFFMCFVNADCDRIAIENPIGFMSTYYRKPDQIIEPYLFGDSAEKKTCLWLKGLPLLQATNIVTPPERIKFKSGKTMSSWYAAAWHLPKEERAKARSKTFPGIARAMAEQWGKED